MKTFPTTPELIRAEINRLHARNSGDWQSLMRQTDEAYRTIQYNTAQTVALLIGSHFHQVKSLDLEWGRGTGKTTVFAAFARRIARDLPRGVFQWEVPTYMKFLTEIIPAFIHSMEMQGLYKDLHYFIGRRPPDSWHWPMPYKPPMKYDNFISTYTGFGIALLSQDIPGAGRGLSTDGRFADETAMLDRQKLEDVSGPSLRGSNTRVLGSKRFFDFRLMASSTPLTEDGAWFIEREELAQMDPEAHKFLRANCVENIELGWLKPDYLTEARRTATDVEAFNAEYLNIRPRFVRGGFYALLNRERHTYTNFNYGHYGHTIGAIPDCRGDADLVAGAPLVLGLDWGAAINSMTVCQNLPGEFRTLKNLFTLGRDGETQDDLADRFADYYQYHQPSCADVYLWYDQTGNAATGTSKLTRAQQMEKKLREKGWKVHRMTISGRNPDHEDKHFVWERLLEEKDPRLPRFRINIGNCRELWVSMTRAKSKRGLNGTIKKDKSGERSDNPKRQFATDLSDAIDQPVYGLFKQVLRGYGAPLPDGGVVKR